MKEYWMKVMEVVVLVGKWTGHMGEGLTICLEGMK
jgi:hypothetical protein